jgi:nucleotide-binding universal stress UspA family protein
MALQERPIIVVGADGSEASIGALRWAIEHARRVNGSVVVITGYVVPLSIWVVPDYTDADYRRDAQRALDATTSAVADSLGDVPMEARLVHRRPAHALTETALELDAEMLVVGGQGHGAIAGMHLGSVANYCAHHAPCPVVIHRGRPVA